jgi:hypothetical protein
VILTIFALSVQVHRDETMVNISNLLIVQADEGTTLKLNLLIEFKGEDMLALGKRKVPFCSLLFYNMYMVRQSIIILLRY